MNWKDRKLNEIQAKVDELEKRNKVLRDLINEVLRPDVTLCYPYSVDGELIKDFLKRRMKELGL